MARRGVPRELRWTEGIFRLSEKPDVRGKTFAFFGAFAKEGRPRGRNRKSPRTSKRRMNTLTDAAALKIAATATAGPADGSRAWPAPTRTASHLQERAMHAIADGVRSYVHRNTEANL